MLFFITTGPGLQSLVCKNLAFDIGDSVSLATGRSQYCQSASGISQKGENRSQSARFFYKDATEEDFMTHAQSQP